MAETLQPMRAANIPFASLPMYGSDKHLPLITHDMKQIAALVLLAFCAHTSEGVSSKPSYPACEETKLPTECPANVLPGGSCIIERWGWDKVTDGSLGRNIDCENLKLNETLDGALLKNSQKLVEIKLGVYQYLHNYRSYPNPTISFSKINCSDVMVKLSVLNSNITSCIKFLFSSSDHRMMETADFLYDCRWLPHQYTFIEDPMTIEYQASNKIYAEYKKYYFSLPKNGTVDREATDFRDFQLLVYREDVDDPPCITIHWSKAPEKLNVTKYRVTLHSTRDNGTKPDSFYVEDTKKSFCSLPETGTEYIVSVEPCREPCLENNCTCGASSDSDPFFTNASNVYITVALEVALFILVIILLVVWSWFWYIRRYARKRTTKFKNCIVVYEPSCERHVNVVGKLVEFLQSLGVPVRYAEKDIQNENSRDWYGEELSKADLIFIVSNPTPKSPSDIMTASIFHPVHVGGCVKGFLSDLMSRQTKKKFIKILLPYCNEKDFYKFTRTKKCYHLRKEPHGLLQEILGPNVWIPWFLSWILYAPYFRTVQWEQLEEAISEFERFNHVSETTAPLKENEYDQSRNTFSSSISEDEGGPDDLDLRHEALLRCRDEESSDSESKSQYNVNLEEACDQISINVAMDELVDAELQRFRQTSN